MFVVSVCICDICSMSACIHFFSSFFDMLLIFFKGIIILVSLFCLCWLLVGLPFLLIFLSLLNSSYLKSNVVILLHCFLILLVVSMKLVMNISVLAEFCFMGVVEDPRERAFLEFSSLLYPNSHCVLLLDFLCSAVLVETRM